MKYFKNLFLNVLYTLLCFVVLTLLITSLNYFNYNYLNIGKIIVPIISLIFGGFLMGKKVKKNGYLEGLKISLIIVFIFIIISLVLGKFTFKNLIYYLILIIAGICGSILGINKNT